MDCLQSMNRYIQRTRGRRGLLRARLFDGGPPTSCRPIVSLINTFDRMRQPRSVHYFCCIDAITQSALFCRQRVQQWRSTAVKGGLCNTPLQLLLYADSHGAVRAMPVQTVSWNGVSVNTCTVLYLCWFHSTCRAR